METLSLSQKARLVRRKGVYHYRRRVPDALVTAIGKREIHRSLGTTSLAEAKRRRTLEDVRWDVRFAAAGPQPDNSKIGVSSGPNDECCGLSDHVTLRLVQEFVARLDECSRRAAVTDPPANEGERAQVRENIETGIGILQNRDDPRADEWVDATIKKLVGGPQSPLNETALSDVHFAEITRRGLLELQRRQLARLDGNHGNAFFDSAFDPGRVPNTTFGELARQYLDVTEEECAVNCTSQKWVDKQKANVALLKEIIGANTHLGQVDYDVCLRVRGVLARLPSNRSKLYADLSIEEAIAAAQAAGNPTLSPVTQEVYLSTLRAILGLGLRKRLIAVNPADGMKPLKKDTIAADAKRLPLTPEQLKQFFEGAYYQQCAQHSPAWSYDKQGWRFWLPLLCLFMGMRPNEVCQMAVADVRRTEHGTWYLDIVASTDEDEDTAPDHKKVLKTATSRRRVPINPELITIGFLDFVDSRRKASAARLFPTLKADSYGNYAKYALKRFREAYLPAEIKLAPRQSFYSLRHTFRDALRAVNAPSDVLQALGGWSQGRLVSDVYGDKSNPDYQKDWINRVKFTELDLSHLYAPATDS